MQAFGGIGLNVIDAAQLSPHTYRWPADLLKLADAPTGGPSLYALRGVLAIAAFQILVNVATVDVLGDVLRDIAGGAALGFVYALEVAAMFLSSWLIVGALTPYPWMATRAGTMSAARTRSGF